MFCKKISIAVLGSTGSIGKTTLKIIEKNSNIFKVDLLTCNKNKKIILNQINKFLPRYVIINNKKVFNYFKTLKFKKRITFFYGLRNFQKFNKLNRIKFKKVILGISSINGIDYAFSFLNYSKEILIANKETIVCGGKFFLSEARKKNCKITSIDSEHFCLAKILYTIKDKDIDQVYLTASGGPFLDKNIKEISKINSKMALKHPRWKMGKKISIDSATMANKGLELIEASILFDINPNKIKIKIHKESKVHAAVVLKNGLVYLVAHNTSMSIPIENSLLNNISILTKKNFFIEKKNFIFSFDEINLKKFKMIPLAYKVLNYGQRGCIFYNVINDILVNLYLNKKIFYYQIYNILNKIISNKNLIPYFKKKIKNINEIYETISYAKTYVS